MNAAVKTDSVPSQSLPEVFFKRASQSSDQPALYFKDKTRQQYQSINWAAWSDSVRNTAKGLYHLGVRAGDRVAILSENRPEWTYADLGILSLGAVVVPIYPTSSAQEVAYILKNAGVSVLFVSTADLLMRVREILAPCEIKHVIAFDLQNKEGNLIPLSQLLEDGRGQQETDFEKSWKQVRPDDVATLIYTSGTTGPPKGVMLTHGNFIANFMAASKVISVNHNDLALSFLPLSHVFERLAGYYFMIYNQVPIAYAESMQTVADDMGLVRPTVAAAVPRFYEKMYAKILENVQAGSPIKKIIFLWAIKTGREHFQAEISKKGISPFLKFRYRLAQKLVFTKIKNRIGGRLRFFISGGAPLSKELAEFFYSAGILILEGYGLTETSPVISVNCPSAFKFGTVGRPLPGIQVKIASDGEILTAGPCVMKGYYKNEAATHEAIKDGWFHTGDIGEIDRDGFLKITDRKKDLIVTSGGKNISPQNIENTLRGDKLFCQVILIGDKRNYLVALIVPDRQEIQHMAQEAGLGGLDWKALLNHPEIYTRVEARLREKTKDLAPYEQIKYFALLDKELSQESGDLTPTLKVRRKIVTEKYRDVIEALYAKGQKEKAK